MRKSSYLIASLAACLAAGAGAAFAQGPLPATVAAIRDHPTPGQLVEL